MGDFVKTFGYLGEFSKGWGLWDDNGGLRLVHLGEFVFFL
jgi:hypothetical protein